VSYSSHQPQAFEGSEPTKDYCSKQPPSTRGLEAPTFSRGAANQSSTHQKIQRRGQDTPTVPTTRAVAYSFDTDERRPHHHSGGGGFQSAGYHFIPKGNGAQLPPLEKRLKRFQSFPVLDSE
jgi:hypothetical protein